MSGEQWIVNSDSKLGGFLAHAAELYRQHKYVTFSWSTGQQRSAQQNNALQLWCERVAKTLNDAGLEMTIDLPTGKEWTIPWSKNSVKEQIWRPVQKAMTGETSTTKPKRLEYSQVYDVIYSRFAGHGITLPLWPSKEKG